MTAKRKVEVFSAGCTACEDTIAIVRDLACPSCEVEVIDMHQAGGAERAKALGVLSVPAVAIDGKLADCCAARGPDATALQAAGLGRPLG